MIVVAGYPGGSPDIPQSMELLGKHIGPLREMGIQIVDSIEELLDKVDVVLVLSIDGRVHLEQAKPVFAAGKRVFIDKPIAASLADAMEIFRLAKVHNVPCFSSSSLRFAKNTIDIRKNPKVGEVLGCDQYSPCALEPHHPDFFWYGIHGVEPLFTIMGPGCAAVTRVHTKGADVAVGVWKDGRIGTFRGTRGGARGYGSTVFGSKAIVPGGTFDGYEPLIVEIIKFFKSGKPPVSAAETLEILAFMEAADQSKREGGRSVTIESVMEKARKTIARTKAKPTNKEKNTMEFDHIGIITDEKKPDETFIPATRVWVTDMAKHPFKVEWLRFEPDSTLTGPVRHMPHVAYRVDNIEAASKGMKVLLEPFDVGFAVVGFYQTEDGAVVEFMKYKE